MLRDKRVEKGTEAQPAETDRGKGDASLGKGAGAEKEPRGEKTDTKGGQEAQTDSE